MKLIVEYSISISQFKSNSIKSNSKFQLSYKINIKKISTYNIKKKKVSNY